MQDSEQQQRNLIVLSDTNADQIQSSRRSDASEKEVRSRSSDSEQNKTTERPEALDFHWTQF